MSAEEELFALVNKLKAEVEKGEQVAFKDPTSRLKQAAELVAKAFSGSWLGYHSCVYYHALEAPPPGAHFSQEWGLKRMYGSSLGSHGNWEEFSPQQVQSHIEQLAGKPDLSHPEQTARHALQVFNEVKAEALSIISYEVGESSKDSFLNKKVEELEALEALSASEIVEIYRPSGRIITRDTTAVGQGSCTPPHIEPMSKVVSMEVAIETCRKGVNILSQIASHVERKLRRSIAKERIGTNVFLGHGRSSSWRELKDFVQDRLSLPCDEFNRVPIAGLTNIARLSEMLDAAALAFLILTGEDELADGATQARMNVVHEVGLFQGRLGFTKAIVLLEEGCQEFSNIQGLGQIRFPKGNISAVFEDIRRVVEREIAV